MATEATYYVYILFRDCGSPFYVGLGRSNRWLAHEQRAHLKRTHKDRLIAKILLQRGDIPKIKVRENVTKQQAIETEIALIATLGREPTGPLINQTSGGDGVADLKPELRKTIGQKVGLKLKGRQRPAEVIAKITATKRAQAATETVLKPKKARRIGPFRHSLETRQRISEAGRGRVQTAEKSRRISEATRGRKLSEEHRAKISAVQIGRKEDPAKTKIRTAKSLTKYMELSPEERRAITLRGWEKRRAKRNESAKSFS